MSITQEPSAVEVLCYQCSGLGKLRITFGDPPQWVKCRKCCGTGKLQRSGGVFVGVLPDLSEVVREEKEAFGKRKDFGQCGGESRPAPDVRHGQGERACERPATHLTQPEAEVAFSHCPIPSADRCHLCEERVVMTYENRKYCAVHGMELMKRDK